MQHSVSCAQWNPVPGPCDCGAKTRQKQANDRAAAKLEKQRIVRSLLDQADAAHEARNYHDRDRYRDAAWLVERA